jgi:hypothetical protein
MFSTSSTGCAFLPLPKVVDSPVPVVTNRPKTGWQPTGGVVPSDSVPI